MRLEFLLYSLIFVLIGLMLVSFFLIWNWFDARAQVKVVREATREQTIHAIRHAHNKCRVLLYISLFLTICYLPIPFILGEFYGTLAYPGVVFIADVLMLFGLRGRAKMYIASIDEYVQENEEHVREAAAQREQQREQWKRVMRLGSSMTYLSDGMYWLIEKKDSSMLKESFCVLMRLWRCVWDGRT